MAIVMKHYEASTLEMCQFVALEARDQEWTGLGCKGGIVPSLAQLWCFAGGVSAFVPIGCPPCARVCFQISL
jgi:hypothetical protein